MLKALLKELEGLDVTAIDDGSKEPLDDPRVIRTGHEGKRGFWRKWVIARQICLGSEHDYFLFLGDDFSNLNLKAIKEITKQGWDDSLFAVNILNDKREECWGRHSTGQESFKVGSIEYKEVGFVDCGYLTNRFTLEMMPIKEVEGKWFSRPDISSGVGYNQTLDLRRLGARLMMPTPSLCEHGLHPSKMHGKHRVDVELSLKFPTYCINLKNRPEKWEETKNECKKIGIEPIRFEAVRDVPGWQGCRKSHLKLLSEIEDDIFMIIEDDIKLNVYNPVEMIEVAIDQLPDNWDILYFGGTLNQKLKGISPNLFRLRKGWTTHAMLFNNQNGVKDFILRENPQNRIDVFYADVVQEKFNCFITSPMTITQRPGFSDIINTQTDYSIITERYNKFT